MFNFIYTYIVYMIEDIYIGKIATLILYSLKIFLFYENYLLIIILILHKKTIKQNQ